MEQIKVYNFKRKVLKGLRVYEDGIIKNCHRQKRIYVLFTGYS